MTGGMKGTSGNTDGTLESFFLFHSTRHITIHVGFEFNHPHLHQLPQFLLFPKHMLHQILLQRTRHAFELLTIDEIAVHGQPLLSHVTGDFIGHVEVFPVGWSGRRDDIEYRRQTRKVNREQRRSKTSGAVLHKVPCFQKYFLPVVGVQQFLCFRDVRPFRPTSRRRL